jgi:DNA-binding transcriptional LysR family regulator
MVEVREARYFIAVAEELHFGRAAQRLHMSQPPLSQAIKVLEHRLGVQLLNRSTREVTLTTVGAVFLEHCRSLVNIAQAAETAAQVAADGQTGRLSIGAVTSAFLDPLPSVLEHFMRAHPRVDVCVEEIDSHWAVQALRRRELDVALVRQLAVPFDCTKVSVRIERFVLAMPARWSASLDQPVTDLAAAAQFPWIWIPRTISPDYHDQVVACCRAAGFAPDARHTARSITSQLSMVACGLGVALVPESASQPPTSTGGENIRYVSVKNSAEIELAAVSRQGENMLIRGFLDSVRGAIGDTGREQVAHEGAAAVDELDEIVEL